MKEEKDPRHPSRSISRRDFARHAALAAASAAVLPGSLLPGASLSPAATQQPQETKLSPESRAEADAKIEAILRKYGKRLSEEQKADIRRLVAEGQKSLESLRSFALDNADQPATVFEIFPEAQTGGRAAAPRRRAR